MYKSNHENCIKRKTFFDTFTTMYLLLYFLLDYINQVYSLFSNNLLSLLYMFSSVALLLVLFFVKNSVLSTKTLIFILATYSSLIFSSMYNTNVNLTFIILYSKFILFALLLLYTKINFDLSRIVMYLFFIFHLLFIFSNRNADELFINLSRNNVSIYLILFISFYYISAFQNSKKISFWPSLLSVIISAWSSSRGGVISTSILFILTFFNYNTYKKKSSYVAICFLIIFALQSIFFQELFYMNIVERFNQDHSSGITRLDIISQYVRLSSMSFYDSLFGSNLNSIPYIYLLKGNPHNSFVNLHAVFGLLYFLIVIYILLLTIVYYFKSKSILFLVLIAIVLRSLTDIPLFGGIYDIIFLYTVFYYFERKQRIFGSVKNFV